MAITINPNRINVQTGKTGAGTLADRKKTQDGGGEFIVPKRANINIIPEPESLATMIRSAVASLRKGVLWDRGTMLNLVV